MHTNHVGFRPLNTLLYPSLKRQKLRSERKWALQLNLIALICDPTVKIRLLNSYQSIFNGVAKCIKIFIIENDTIKIVFNGLSILGIFFGS